LLVEDQDAGGHRFEEPAKFLERNALARRVVRARDEDDVGVVFLDGVHRNLGVKAEIVGAVGHQPLGLRAVGDDRVHGVRRYESDRASSRPPERLQQLLQNFVGAVGSPEVLDTDVDAGLSREVRRELAAQSHRVAVGIPVQVACDSADRAGDIVDQRLGRWMRVLVGVEPHGHRELWCAVRRFAAQVLAKRKIVQGNLVAWSHVSNLRRTASP
jgi:hypothetical protein